MQARKEEPREKAETICKNGHVDIELFAGAGGLTLGLAAAGLDPDHLFEQNKWCCATLRENSSGRHPLVTGQIHEGDVNNFDWSKITSPVRVLSGGPPCQPFSFAGKHLAEEDGRNQFPVTLRLVRELAPAVVLLENVPGLARPSFRPYLDYIVRQLSCPACAPRHDELWQEHDARLRRVESRGTSRQYNVQWWVLNAADYGVPQARVRVVFVASKVGLPIVQRPRPTHSRAALMKAQSDGTYSIARTLDPIARSEWPKRIHGESGLLDDSYRPWKTVRDAFVGLPCPMRSDSVDPHHVVIDGARLYDRHSGSELDWPAKTVKAGVHGVAGGENVLLLNGGHRYFTLRELSRLQGFPDRYRFAGPRSRVIGQIGNAVPVALARAIGHEIRKVVNDL
jgi:DNA (cytosine-5)-methyltransferase 1